MKAHEPDSNLFLEFLTLPAISPKESLFPVAESERKIEYQVMFYIGQHSKNDNVFYLEIFQKLQKLNVLKFTL